MPGFFSGWATPPFPPPFFNGWTPGSDFLPQNTWMPMSQFMAHNNTSTGGYENPAYYPPPMPPGMTSGGSPDPGGPAPSGPAPDGGVSMFPPVRKKRGKAERRLWKQIKKQQQEQQQQTQPQERQHPNQQYQQHPNQQYQQQQQLPPQPPASFPQAPASLPAIPPTAGKPGKKRPRKPKTTADNQLLPQQPRNHLPLQPPPFTHPQRAPLSHPQRPPLPPLNRDAISAPSAASGGIPNPTPSYLAQAALPPRPASKPQPLLVIIDLNGTLLHRPSPRAPSTFIERPRAREFLLECLDAFYVVIWSSARPDNVSKMVRQLLPEPAQRARVLATWGRDRFGLSAADYNQRTQCYKRLTSVWADPGVAAAHPMEGGRWGQENTVLIDDSVEKARSEPFNAVTIPEFTGRKGEKDEVLPLVQQYLYVLSMQADVSAFVRTHPFKADADTIAEYARSATEGNEAEGQAEKEIKGEATG